MSLSRKKSKHVYPLPIQNTETAGFVEKDSLVHSIKEQGIAGYDLVYVADLSQRKVFMFGKPEGFSSSVSLDLSSAVHEQAHQKAQQGEVVSYEWSVSEKEDNCFFQSILLPLKDSSGEIGSVLGLVRNITSCAAQSSPIGLLRENAGKTFAQLLLAAREEERRKISSALHDEIGSSAVILTSLLSMVKQSVEERSHQQALKDIASLDFQLKESIERIKNIVVSLRPANLEAVGLADALQDMLSNLTHYKGIKHSFTLETEDELLPSDEVNIVLYRVAQESLNNIVKHSGATKVEVLLKVGPKKILLQISDNGKGFKVSKQRSIKHIGLLSMRDSVAYLGGKFSIKSDLGKGTTVQAECPKVVYGVNEL